MKNNKNFDNTNASQARDFWTARLDDCPHERLREALKFQPLHAAPKQVVKTDGQTNLRKGQVSLAGPAHPLETRSDRSRSDGLRFSSRLSRLSALSIAVDVAGERIVNDNLL